MGKWPAVLNVSILALRGEGDVGNVKTNLAGIEVSILALRGEGDGNGGA